MNREKTSYTLTSRILKSWGIPFCIATIALFSYINGINGEFVFDDIPIIQLDNFYSDSDTSMVDCWSRSYWPAEMASGLYRPVTLASFLLNVKTSGIYAPAFRLFNILLHAIIAILVFRLALRLRFGHIPAIFAGIVFAVHPLHTEAVIPAIGRAELLCAFFVILGLLSHIKAYQYKITKTHSVWKYRIATGLFFLLACWSKENGVILLPLCILYDLLFQLNLIKICHFSKRSRRAESETCNLSNRDCEECHIHSLIMTYLPIIIALTIVVISRIAGTGTLMPRIVGTDIFVDNPLIDAPLLTRTITALHVQGMVVVKMFWPQILAHDYSYAQIIPSCNLLDPYAILAIFSLLLLPLLLCVLLPKRKKIILFLGGAYIISILPAGNFLTPSGTIFGERLYYTPSLFFILLFMLIIFDVAKKMRSSIPRLRVVVASILSIAIIAAILRDFARSEEWRNGWTIALSAVEVSPNSVKTWNNLAKELGRKGEYEDAIAACNRGLQIMPDFESLLTNRIYYYIALKRYNDAEKALMEIINAGSKDPEMYNFLGGILATKGKMNEAKQKWRQSLKIKPNQQKIINALESLP